jgi:hypothetical protein
MHISYLITSQHRFLLCRTMAYSFSFSRPHQRLTTHDLNDILHIKKKNTSMKSRPRQTTLRYSIVCKLLVTNLTSGVFPQSFAHNSVMITHIAKIGILVSVYTSVVRRITLGNCGVANRVTPRAPYAAPCTSQTAGRARLATETLR